MALQTYIYAAGSTIVCAECRNLAVGDQVDIYLRTEVAPGLPDSVRGVVQSVSDTTYEIEYDDDQLLGVIPSILDEHVDRVECVPCLKLAQEYTDAEIDASEAAQEETDNTQDGRLTAIEDVLANLGLLPKEGDNQFVVHPDSYAGVSIESHRSYKLDVPLSDSGEIILDPTELASPLGILDLTGLSFRLDVEVNALTSKPTNDRDSLASFVMVGDYDAGATILDGPAREQDTVDISLNNVGGNAHVNVVNPSSGNLTVYVTTKFRVFNPAA